MGSWAAAPLRQLKNCNGDASCLMSQVACRVGAAFAIVSLAHTLLISCTSRERSKEIHGSSIIQKAVLVPILSLSFLFLPFGFGANFLKLCLWLSWSYYFVQTVVLVDFAYSWNEAWLDNAQEADERGTGREGRVWLAAVVTAALLVLVMVGVSTVGIYTTFAEHRRMLWSSMGIWGVLTLFSITSLCRNGALLPSAVIGAFVSVQTWLALVGAEGGPGGPHAPLAKVVVEAVLLSLTVWLTAASAGGGETTQGGGDGYRPEGVQEAAAAAPDPMEEARAFRWFHAALTAAAVYLPLVATNWGSPKELFAPGGDGGRLRAVLSTLASIVRKSVGVEASSRPPSAA
eukprot:Polyplicarium_translucidae@DN3140_c0_g1_i10.p2